MIILRTLDDLRALPPAAKARVFVPTMGALHEGHASLINEATKHGDQVVVSIFVNPTQFAPNEDLSKYPRTLDADLELCREMGATYVFVPDVATMYPEGAATKIEVSGVAEGYEGTSRPTHFNGVATVVLALFNMVQPNIAVFGRKDLQQCAVIAQLVRDLHVPVSLVISPTVREPSGLALSSRNRYLSDEHRQHAAHFYETLCSCRDAISNNFPIEDVLASGRQALVDHGFEPEYLDLIAFESFQPARITLTNAYLVGALRWQGVRLIDNIPV